MLQLLSTIEDAFTVHIMRSAWAAQAAWHHL